MSSDEKPKQGQSALHAAGASTLSDVVLALLTLHFLLVVIVDSYRLPLLDAPTPGAGPSALLLLGWIGLRRLQANRDRLSRGGLESWCVAHLPDLLAAGVVVTGLVLRLAGTGYGAPLVLHPDEPAVVGISIHMLKTGSLEPLRHIYPTVFHYLLLPAFAVYFVRGAGQGLWATMADVRGRDFGFFYIGRVYSAVLGAATIALLYGVAKKMWPNERGKWAGVMAATLLAFSFTHVRASQNAVTDAPMTFFAIVAFLAVLAVYQVGSMRSYALAGFLCGIAVATKLNALPVVFALPLAHLLGRRPGEWLGARPLLGAVMIPAGFLTGYPYALLGWVPFLETTAMVSRIQGAAAVAPAGRLAQIVGYLNESGMGTPFFLLTVVAIVYYTYRRHGEALLAIAVIAANLVLLTHSGWGLKPRYNILMMPLAALLVGGLLAELGAALLGWARRSESWPVFLPRRLRPVLAGGIVVLLLASAVLPQARESIEYTQLRNWDDTRTLAYNFIVENVGPHANVATEVGELQLPRTYTVRRWPLMHAEEPARFDDRHIRIVVLSGAVDKLVAGDAVAEQRRAEIRETMRLLAEFRAIPGVSMGPTVGVYRNKPKRPPSAARR